MGVNVVLILSALSVVFGATIALQCFQCGQYNDGVGSITPCTNYTHMQIKDCPSKDHTYCIKYVSEGSTVRDCVAKCVDRENWSQRTYCCQENGCNSAPRAHATSLPAAILLTIPTLVMALFRTAH